MSHSILHMNGKEHMLQIVSIGFCFFGLQSTLVEIIFKIMDDL
jgi:hypothetical protein